MNKQNIQIAHSSVLDAVGITSSRAVAELRLKNKTFRPGEFAMVSYEGEDDTVQALVAIGTEGGGFRTLNAGNVISVRKVSDWSESDIPEDVAPDVTQLVDEQIYILRCSVPHPEKGILTGDWVKAYITNDQVRDFEKLGNDPCIFLELESGYHWFYRKVDSVQKVYREDNIFTDSDAKEILNTIANLNLSISLVNGETIDIKYSDSRFINLEFTSNPESYKDKFDWYVDDIKVADRGTHIKNNWTAIKGEHELKGKYLVGETGFTLDVYSSFKVRDTYPIYYGTLNQSLLNKKFISEEDNFELKNILVSNDRLVFKYPKVWGDLKHIKDQGELEYINSYAKTEETISEVGIPYYCYNLINPITIDSGGFSQTYILNNLVSLESYPIIPSNTCFEQGTGNNSVVQVGGNNTANGKLSFATGNNTIASGSNAHTEGLGTVAMNSAEHAGGKYNASHTNTIHSIGVGNSESSRTNAFEVLNDGSVYVKGVDTYNGTNPTNGTNDLKTVISSKQSSQDQNLVTTNKTVVGAINENKERIDNLSTLGRFLSVWDCQTGLPYDNPATSVYSYKSGDFYIVGKVATKPAYIKYQPTGGGSEQQAWFKAYYDDGNIYYGSPGTYVKEDSFAVGSNVYYYDPDTEEIVIGTITEIYEGDDVCGNQRVPSGTAYSVGVASETLNDLGSMSPIKVGDVLKYTATGWVLLPLSTKEAIWGSITGTLSNQTDLQNALNDRNISINITYSQLKQLRDNSQLIPGRKYRITDFVTTSNDEGPSSAKIRSAEHPFDIIVTADSNNTLNEEAKAVLHEGDTYFNTCNLAAWELKYCLDNNKNRFSWAKTKVAAKIGIQIMGVMYFYRKPSEDAPSYTYGIAWEDDWENKAYTATELPTPGTDLCTFGNPGEVGGYSIYSYDQPILEEGKGVIYYMKDEWNNECSYDFKNIQFKRIWDNTHSMWSTASYTGDGVFAYTFSSAGTSSSTSFSDISLSGSNSVTSNIIMEYNNAGKLELNNVCFFGTSSYDNIIKKNCKYITFGGNCQANIIGESISSSLLYTGCTDNIFGNGSNSNILKYSCCHNRFGDGCSCNTLNGGNDVNIFYSGSYSNKLGMGCSQNHFKGNCDYNTIGDYSSHNTFDTECSYNTIGNYCCYNTFGKGCDHNIFSADNTGSTAGHYFFYNTLENGVAYNIIYNTQTASRYYKVQYYKIKSSMHFESNTMNMVTRGKICSMTVAKNSSGIIKEYCEADLMA